MRLILHLYMMIVLVGTVPLAAADDWYRWRGPAGTGISQESNWRKHWTDADPAVLWEAYVGTGLSSVSVQDGRLFTAGNELNVDTVYCLDAETGEAVWEHSYPSPLGDNEFEGGPTSTATVDGDAVYFLGREGDLFCFDAADGEVRWSKNVSIEADVRVPAWGFAGSPVVVGDRLLLNIGDAGLAVDKRTGSLLWSSGDKDAGYATPVVFEEGENTLAIIASGRSYVAVDASTGAEQWRQRWLTTFGCNAADPILDGEQVFISSGYNRGAALLDISQGNCKVIWKNKEMQNQLSTSILIDGYLYGISGDVEAGAELRCLELASGELQWNDGSVRYGALSAADGHLIVLSDSGELLIAPADPEGFRPVARSQVVEGKCWTAPVLANGRIYCRTAEGSLVSVDVREG